MSDNNENAGPNGVLVDVSFVRHRNALVARADLKELQLEYYLHLAEHGIRHDAEQDELFKRALAAFTLHCASRPRVEMIAWTVNFQEPLLNIFLTGDNEAGSVTGRIFDENVKEGGPQLFFSEVVRRNKPVHRSTVAFRGRDPVGAVEEYYLQSEQRPARYFTLGESELVMVSSHPDCDMEWFHSLNARQAGRLDETETIVGLERRVYQWRCGCNDRRLFGVLAPVMREDPQSLFGDEDSLRTQCPRCGARYHITREALEAFVEQADRGRA